MTAAAKKKSPINHRLSAREIHDECADDEFRGYHTGTKKDSAYENFSILGVSFERKSVNFDEALGGKVTVAGREQFLSPRLVEAVKKKASEIYVKKLYRRKSVDAEWKMIKVMQTRQADITVRRDERKVMIENRNSIAPGGLVKMEWCPLSDDIILEEK